MQVKKFKIKKSGNDNGRKSNGGNGASYTGCGTECSGYLLVPGMPFSYKIGGRIICQGEEKIMPDEMDQMITRIYEITKNRSMERILAHGDDDFSFAIPGVSRFRANIFRQRGSLAAVIRVVRFELRMHSQLNLPDAIMGIAKLTRGMVLVTGPAGKR